MSKFPKSFCLTNSKVKSILAPYSNRSNKYSKRFSPIKRINNDYIIIHVFSCNNSITPFHRNVGYFATIKASCILITKSHLKENLAQFFCTFISNRNESFCSRTKENMIIISKHPKQRSRIIIFTNKFNYFKSIIKTRQIPYLVGVNKMR